MIGLHNIRNAASAAAVSYSIGVTDKIIKLGLKNFKGVQRDLIIFLKKWSKFYDDYVTIQQK